MKSRPTIRVTKDNIKNGRRGALGSCPIALAIKQRFKLKRGVAVDGLVIRIGKCTYNVPRVANKFVKEFDALGGRLVKPIKFKLPESRNG